MNARLEALAYRIWAYCEPLGWNCTAREIADALGETYQQIGHVIRIKRWTGRLRGTQPTSHTWDRRAHKAPVRIDAEMKLSGGEALF